MYSVLIKLVAKTGAASNQVKSVTQDEPTHSFSMKVRGDLNPQSRGDIAIQTFSP